MSDSSETAVEPELHHENPVKVVWALAWPAVALNSLQVVNTLLDRAFIGHLPTESLTAHGGSMNAMFLMFSLAMSVAVGATALVARAFGAGEKREFRRASRQAVSLSVALGLVAAALTCLFGDEAAAAILPRSDTEAIALMGRFLFAYGIGLPAIYIIQTLAGCLRGIGDTKSPMYISGLQILLHICLNYFLIFPPHQFLGMRVPGMGLGLIGAAVALTVSAWMAALAYLVFSGYTPLGALWKMPWPDLTWAWRILKIAIPAGVMSILRVLSLTAFTLVLAVVPGGSVAIAAMTVGFAIESIMFMPAFGLSAAAGALVGQSLGMKRPDRAERLAWTAAHHAALVTVALVLPIYIGAPGIAHLLLGGKEDVVAQAVSLLRWLCITEIFFAYAMVMLGSMQGAGDTTRPLWITVFSLWGLRVPLALFLAMTSGQVLFSIFGAEVTMPFGLSLGPSGAWISLSITQAVQGVLAILAFRQGAWKTKKV
ncbi:MAG TPA: MATE family efflux transporter [Fimbriimonas sp.]|nr:MATE family efflux transporter [Fimbriimonas sp.]